MTDGMPSNGGYTTRKRAGKLDPNPEAVSVLCPNPECPRANGMHSALERARCRAAAIRGAEPAT